MSFARKHFQKHSAISAAKTAAEFGSMQDLSFYELHLAQLNNDRHRLKQIQSTEAKVQLKTNLLPNYLPYVDGILEANNGELLRCTEAQFFDQAAGLLLTKIARRALRRPRASNSRNGIPLLPVSDPQAVVTLDMVNALRDELP